MVFGFPGISYRGAAYCICVSLAFQGSPIAGQLTVSVCPWRSRDLLSRGSLLYLCVLGVPGISYRGAAYCICVSLAFQGSPIAGQLTVSVCPWRSRDLLSRGSLLYLCVIGVPGISYRGAAYCICVSLAFQGSPIAGQLTVSVCSWRLLFNCFSMMTS